MNYYKRHLGDYASAAGHLTALEHGIYNLLIDWYYANEQPIPDASAHRIARSPREAVQVVLDEFFQRDGDCWRQKRVDHEIELFRIKSAENRRIGKLGGRPKKTETVSEDNRNETETVPDQNRNVTLANSHKPITINKNNKGDEYAADFCSFWESWPEGFGSKGSKQAAFAEWRKAKPDAETLIRSATAQAAEKAMKRRNGDFAENFKHVCRWLKGREWENEVTQVTRRASL